ncbi:MAG: N-acetylmuramoyl-L-alanine amidase [Alphaproteobacteria bacterium]|nr:N-acetylmuramoyl-L-alanine amidase [Alphaproteobacteria bacterium]
MKHRGSGLALAILAGVVSVAGAAAAGAETEVTQIRLGVHPGAVRVVVEASAKLKISSFVLVRPYRVVLDMPEVRWRLPMGTGRRGKGFVAGYRFGQFVPGRARMVFDLKGPAVIVKSFTIPPTPGRPWRFVLDLKRTTAAEARARAGRRTAAVASARRGQPLARSAKKPQTSQKVVVIDPGHGGVDPGAIGASGSLEKHITLALARELRRLFVAGGRYRVVMTRNRDVFRRLRERIAIAQRADASLFISLHADSMENRRIRGGSVYTLSETASDAEAAALAAKENKADVIAGLDLSDQSPVVAKILIDLRQRLTMNQSAIFAKGLVRELGKSVRMLRNTHRFAGFAVLKAPEIPSVLVELGYLSNAIDERLMRHPGHRRRVATAIVRAVNTYFTRQQASGQP